MMLTGKSRLAGIVGDPVAHSLSPRLHNHWLGLHGIDGAYVPLPVAAEHFSQALRVLLQLGFSGVNVTVPHKEAALAAVDTADHLARRIGAVNTVVFRDDGSIHGTNTDGTGFIAHLRATVPDMDSLSGPVAVIGAGGAARAVCVALADMGVPEIRLCNRTLKRAESLAMVLGPEVRVVNWADRCGALEDARLLVNTTTLGMAGQPGLDLDLSPLPKSAAVYDIVYNPLETPLLADARARGHPVVGGLGMLLHQAVAGFEAWFGVTPEVTDELTAFVAEALR